MPCFRALRSKPPRCAPHGLDESNCVEYDSYDELMGRLEQIDEPRYLALQQGALSWARANSTISRAREFLRACGLSTPADRRQPTETAASPG